MIETTDIQPLFGCAELKLNNDIEIVKFLTSIIYHI